jgi:splicing factor U2AF subunit
MTDGTANPNAVSMLLMQQLQAANPQATRQARRLYVGNMPSGMGITEQMLQEFFNTTVISLGLLTPQPVLSVWISAEGNFCFVEFRAIRDATVCMNLLQGITLGGRVLKVGRPAGYVAPPPYLENFIVGIPADAYKPSTETDGPVGLLGLNLPVATLGMPSAPGQQGIAMGLALPPLMASSISIEQPTEVLMLVNMVSEAELQDDEEFADLVLDVREECAKYGELVQVVIPRPLATDSSRLEGVLPNGVDQGPCIGQALGRIFARFVSPENAQRAKGVLDGRMFGNNRVSASFYDLTKFEAHIYS